MWLKFIYVGQNVEGNKVLDLVLVVSNRII